MGKIFEILSGLGLTSDNTRSLLSNGTRDVESLAVWRDDVSNVIYIDDYYVGDSEYESINYKKSRPDYERLADAERRLSEYKQYFVGKDVCDVGCGEGLFLKGAMSEANSVSGVELQSECIATLEESGITCKKSVTEYHDKFDVIFMFHSLEHFKDPLLMLRDAKSMLKKGGRLVVEVPHANDFLISVVECEAFLKFTLWSQHLVLHTRASLGRMLSCIEPNDIVISGVQRYPLSNHLAWLSEGKPGGHKSLLSEIDTNGVRAAYENALRKIDATDTLVAIVEC
jgi:SAM-dependent methyltransferase